MAKKVSIIVPVYNVSKYLETCIDSLINQTYKELEIILVDDGSTDNSFQICKKFEKKDSRIKLFHKENGGVSSARNLGLEIATGNYIVFVDSDDYIDKECINFCIKLMNKNNVDFICFGAREFYGNVTFNINKKNTLRVIEKSDVFKEYLRLGCGVCDKFFKAELWDSLRFEPYNINEDVLAIYEILKRVNSIAISDNALYNYRQRSSSTSHNKEISMLPYEINLRILKDSKVKCKNNFKYVCARFIYSSMDIYNRIIMYETNNKNKEKIVNSLEIYKNYLYKNEYVPFIKKIQLFVLLHFELLYKIIIKLKRKDK